MVIRCEKDTLTCWQSYCATYQDALSTNWEDFKDELVYGLEDIDKVSKLYGRLVALH